MGDEPFVTNAHKISQKVVESDRILYLCHSVAKVLTLENEKEL